MQRQSFALREGRHLVSTDAFALREGRPLASNHLVKIRLLSFPCYPLPPSGLRPPAGLGRRPSAFGVGLRHARGFASDRALAAAFPTTCGISLDKYMFRLYYIIII